MDDQTEASKQFLSGFQTRRVKILLAAVLLIIITAISLSAYFLLIQKKTSPASFISGSVKSITSATLVVDVVNTDREKVGQVVEIDLKLPTQLKILSLSAPIATDSAAAPQADATDANGFTIPTYVSQPTPAEITDLSVGNLIDIYFENNRGKITGQKILIMR